MSAKSAVTTPLNEQIIYTTQIRPYSNKDLRTFYNISNKTLLRWLKPFAPYIGDRHGWYYNIQQVETIFEKIGRPYNIVER